MRTGGCPAHSSPGTGSLSPVQAKAIFARLNAIAERFFCDRLYNSWVPVYLETRGFDRDVQRRWHAGYAPAEWDALTRHLRTRGCPGTLIEAAGLARRSPRGTFTDTFRDRAVLPIRSPNGTVAGFIGRASDSATLRVPKYINSPRTCLYDKSAALYGVWEGPGRPGALRGPRTMRHRPRTALTQRHVGVLANMADLAATGSWLPSIPNPEGQMNALRSAARLIGAMPPSHVARQVMRLANRLDLDHAMVTQAVIDTRPELSIASFVNENGTSLW